MNKRIKQLADQAENYAYSAVIGGSECMEAYTQKFAELIVRECCKEITQEPFNAGAASLWLKDYFGVKE